MHKQYEAAECSEHIQIAIYELHCSAGSVQCSVFKEPKDYKWKIFQTIDNEKGNE